MGDNKDLKYNLDANVFEPKLNNEKTNSKGALTNNDKDSSADSSSKDDSENIVQNAAVTSIELTRNCYDWNQNASLASQAAIIGSNPTSNDLLSHLSQLNISNETLAYEQTLAALIALYSHGSQQQAGQSYQTFQGSPLSPASSGCSANFLHQVPISQHGTSPMAPGNYFSAVVAAASASASPSHQPQQRQQHHNQHHLYHHPHQQQQQQQQQNPLQPHQASNSLSFIPLLSRGTTGLVPNSTTVVIPSAAGRSRRNSCLTIKQFKTGDDVIDRHLTELYKQVNPRSEFRMDIVKGSKFYVIKSYTEDHVHRSIKYSEWCSTQRGNDVLDAAYQVVSSSKGSVLLFFSVNGSGYFCGVAQMTSRFDPNRQNGHWTEQKWSGGFGVRWLYVKDVPNKYLKHILLEHNDNRPVTNSRDATEIKPREKGIETLRIIHEYHNNSSLFDDFEYYEDRERKNQFSQVGVVPPGSAGATAISGRGNEGLGDVAPTPYHQNARRGQVGIETRQSSVQQHR